MNCWNISDDVEDVQSVASLLSDDYVENISLKANEDGSTNLCATIKNGAVNVFQILLNG